MNHKKLTVTNSLTAISLSCLAEGLDEEAVDVENRAENMEEKARREAMGIPVTGKKKGTRMSITRDHRLYATVTPAMVQTLTGCHAKVIFVCDELYVCFERSAAWFREI